MTTHTIHTVNAFTDSDTGGNPASVMCFNSMPNDQKLLKVARTQTAPVIAFVFPEKENNTYAIRWFSQQGEISLCGHGTLAAASILFSNNPNVDELMFTSPYGNVTVNKVGNMLSMIFPAWKRKATKIKNLQFGMSSSNVVEHFSTRDLVIVLENQLAVELFEPNKSLIQSSGFHAIIVTAKGNKSDYVLRFFAPSIGIDEDAATGSAQCSLAKYWVEKLNKDILQVEQLSSRKGTFTVENIKDSIVIKTKTIILPAQKITM
ncbi:PhzF family phenazine biosynthesis protein [Thalassotalea fonticola]|uniref:PhzF family phenazine biosynthesis protein n=1 Tax=Thalassotalea fonticola TaxID=3065649 RepID=A0ABZ0GNC7_9GAMM|nr:PhzF family phenazine biosynthesis protein [Colwelliaceae bacterium S1-1]